MKRNPRPRKYESAAARQAAYKARAEVLEFRAEAKTAASLTSIAQELDVSRSELLLSMVKFALTNHDWARFGLTHKTLPYYQGNPIMATKKATPAQLAARKKFVEMVRSGAFKKAKRAADRDKNPAKVIRRKANPTKGEKTFKAGDMVITDRKEIGQVTFLKKQPNGFADVYKLLDVKANDPYKSTFLENGNFINGTRLKAYKKRATAKVKSNPMGKSIAGQHLFNLGKNYFASVTLTGYNDYYAQIFYKTTDSSGFTDEQIVPDYKPRHFSTAKAAINSVMKYAIKNKLKSNPIAEMREFTVIKWKRGKNTTNGNPVYEFILKDEFGGMHTGKTKPNAGWVYSISSVYEGDKINAALEETKGGRVYMVDYGKRKSNPVKRSSRSAVVPNPSKKRTYTVFCQVDGQGINNWTKLATFYSATKATQYAKAYAKQYPKHYVRVESHG